MQSSSGGFSGIDGLSLVKGASNPDAAYTYINTSLSPAAQVSIANASGTVPVITGVEDQFSPVAKEFGGLNNIIKHLPILGSVPSKGANGVAGYAEMASVWKDFKDSL